MVASRSVVDRLVHRRMQVLVHLNPELDLDLPALDQFALEWAVEAAVDERRGDAQAEDGDAGGGNAEGKAVDEMADAAVIEPPAVGVRWSRPCPCSALPPIAAPMTKAAATLCQAASRLKASQSAAVAATTAMTMEAPNSIGS